MSKQTKVTRTTWVTQTTRTTRTVRQDADSQHLRGRSRRGPLAAVAATLGLDAKHVHAVVRGYARDEPVSRTGWGGIAPSYLCADFDIGYDEACELLLALQQEGVVIANGNGNIRRLADGRECPTRFSLT